jgi:hypothetical protein
VIGSAAVKHLRQLLVDLVAGYDKRSIGALAAIGAVYGVVWLFNPWLIDIHAEPDFLLSFIWVLMTGALLWRPNPRRDVKLAVVGLFGGLVIEGWGTNTQLWVYFTAERPPLWILPAWPVAALCIDRLHRGTDRLLPWLRRMGPAYWIVLPLFVMLFTRLMRPAITHPWSIGVLVLMAVVVLVRPRPGRDLVLFVTGATLGIFLEYWGTSRHCWTYWNQQVPPIEAVLAHGFASVAFARGVQLLQWCVDRVKRPSGAAARPARG